MNIKLYDKYYNYYLIILILVLIFFYISYKDIKTLLSIIIIIIIGYFLFNYVNKINNEIINKDIIKINKINSDVKNIKTSNSDNFYVNTFTKNNKYLETNKSMIDILININFLKKYDNGKYVDLINYMNQYNKIYIYLLSDRYEPKDYFIILLDTHYLILETLYSIFLIMPDKFKYTFGINIYKEIYKSINEFNKISKKMINTIEKYSKIHKNYIYLHDSHIRPHNMNISKHILP